MAAGGVERVATAHDVVDEQDVPILETANGVRVRENGPLSLRRVHPVRLGMCDRQSA